MSEVIAPPKKSGTEHYFRDRYVVLALPVVGKVRIRSEVAALMATVAVLTAVTACGAEASPPEGPPAGVSVSLAQWRSGEVSRELVVAVRNTGTVPVFFSELRLVTESFAPLPARRVDTSLGRTPRTDLKIPYGEARCAGDRIPQVRPAEVVALLRVGEEPLRTVRFPVPHPDPLLARLVAADCGAFVLRRSAEVRFADSWTEEKTGKDRVLRGTLTVARVRGSEPITIDRLEGTTHYNLRPSSGRQRPVAVLEGGAERLEIPVEVTPLRCDAHAFADAKKAHLFGVAGAVGSGEPHHLTVALPKDLQVRFLEYALRACGLPAPV
jgi:hypothetical protein